jgi:hypothetical protein
VEFEKSTLPSWFVVFATAMLKMPSPSVPRLEICPDNVVPVTIAEMEKLNGFRTVALDEFVEVVTELDELVEVNAALDEFVEVVTELGVLVEEDLGTAGGFALLKKEGALGRVARIVISIIKAAMKIAAILRLEKNLRRLE